MGWGDGAHQMIGIPLTKGATPGLCGVAVTSMASMPNKDISWLAKVGLLKEYSGGESLIEEGRKYNSIYLVLDGIVTVTRKEKLVGDLDAGSIAGELSFLSGKPAVASVSVGKGGALLLEIPGKDIAAKAKKDLAFCCRLYQMLGKFASVRAQEGLGDHLTIEPSKKDIRQFEKVMQVLKKPKLKR
jgi:CRP-like cAMP-binding protein